MKWVNIITQSQTPPAQIEATIPPRRDQLLAHGWREWDESEPALQDGYERLSRQFQQDAGNPERAVMVVQDGLISDRLTAEAAAAEEARQIAADVDLSDPLRKAIVIVMATEIEKVKTAIRTLHPAAAGALPSMDVSEWKAAIKAKALEL